jgi:hypothetical protein
VDSDRLKRLALQWLPGLLAGLLLGAVVTSLAGSTAAVSAPDASRVADMALVSIREQGRITSFAARYVAIVSSAQTSLGLEARKTLVLPGLVRYGIDLRRIRREHMSWDEATGTLSIQLPPLEISGPDIDMEEAREYREGGVLMALTGAEPELDETNLRLARQELLRQAHEPRPLRAAREAAMRTVARGFSLPLRGSGIDAAVAVRFVDPAGEDEAVHLERGRHVEDAVSDRQAGDRRPQ